MKRFLFFTTMLVALSCSVHGQDGFQTRLYEFTPTTESPYTELGDGTVVGSQISGEVNRDWGIENDSYFKTTTDDIADPRTGISIGFTFPYCGRTFTSFIPSVFGGIALGNGEMDIAFNTAIYNHQGAKTKYQVFISPDMETPVHYNPNHAEYPTKVSYKTEGIEPNRELVIEYRNLFFDTAKTGTNMLPLSWQIRLSESGNITFCFAENFKIQGNSMLKFCIGICGGFEKLEDGSGRKDYKILSNSQGALTDKSWATMPTQQTQAMTSFGWGSVILSKDWHPEPGFRFIIQAPADCKQPETLPFFEIVENGSQSITYRTSATGEENADSDGVLCLISRSKTTTTPQNGIVYGQGEKLSEDCIVSYNGLNKDTVQNTERNLLSDTKYYVHTYSYTFLCAHGPIYSAPVIDSFTTRMMPPAISLVATDSSSATIDLSANTQGHPVIVLYSPNPISDDTYRYLNATMTPGDNAGNGTVAYIGSADRIKIGKLPASTHIYISAFSYSDQGGFSPSTVGSHISARTWMKLPADFTLPGEERNAEHPSILPAGFYRTLTGEDPTLTESSYFAYLGNGVFRTKFHDYYGPCMDAADMICPAIYTTDRPSRIRFTVQPPELSGYAPIPGDSLVLQIGENPEELETFRTIWHSPDSLSLNLLGQSFDIPVYGYENKKIFLRWVHYRDVDYIRPGSTAYYSYLEISSFTVEELPVCDRPGSVMSVYNQIFDNKAQIKWNNGLGDNFTGYCLSYSKVGTDIWSEPIAAEASPTFIPLPSATELQVRVAAVCGADTSLWSEPSYPFTTQYAIPYTETFAGWIYGGLATQKTYYTTSMGSLPEDGTPVTFYGSAPDTRVLVKRYRNLGPDFAMGMAFDGGNNDWFKLPVMNLESIHGKATLHVEMAINNDYPSQRERFDPTPVVNDYFAGILLSTDGGVTYTMADTLKSWKDSLSFVRLGQSEQYSFELPGIDAPIQIAFHVSNRTYATSSTPHALHINSIRIDYSCMAVNDMRATDIGEDTARLSWDRAEAPETYTLRYKLAEAPDSAYRYISDFRPGTVLRGLQPDTTYVWGIAAHCSSEDSSGYTSAEFRTKAPYVCALPQNFNSSGSGSNYIELSWNGDAYTYRVAYTVADANEWTYIDHISENSVRIEGLQQGTEYEFKIRSSCSENTTDTSVWSKSVYTYTTIPCDSVEGFRILSNTWSTIQFTFEETGTPVIVSLTAPAFASYQDIFLAEQTPVTITGLSTSPEGILYALKVRHLCASGDSSAWSRTIEVRTWGLDECKAPQNLKAEDAGSDRVKLSWDDSREQHHFWKLCYKESSSSTYDSVNSIKQPEFELVGLNPNTVYVWSVQGNCEENVFSKWAASESFNTLPVSNSTPDLISHKAFEVSTGQERIHILNSSGLTIDLVEIFNLTGQSLGRHEIRSNGNVMIPCRDHDQIILVRIWTGNQSLVYKLLKK